MREPARLGVVTILPESARAVVESGRLAHLVTMNEDGSPQVSCVWIAMGSGRSTADLRRLRLRAARERAAGLCHSNRC